jgi:PAS domain S-box-containing protein
MTRSAADFGMPIPLTVLLVEDQPDDAELLIAELRRAGYQPAWQRVDTEADFLAHLHPVPDLILADYKLPHFDGLRALDLLATQGLDVPFMLVSGSIGEEVAATAMQRGAADYLLKDRPARLGVAVTNALEQRRLRLEKRHADQELRENEARLAGIVGSAMDAILTVDERQRIILFNAAAESTFRCSASEALGHPLARFLPDNVAAPAFRESDIARRVKERVTPITAQRADGETFPAEASISQTDVAGQKLFTIILRDVTERHHAEAALQTAHTELEQAYETTLEGWAKALNLRDPDTERHTARVTEMTLSLAERLGFSAEDRRFVKWGALLHDIGKMGIPDSILLKPGPLTDEEWSIMRLHPGYAYQMLAPIVYLRSALNIPYCHHEKWDGGGYPRNLSGEAIPLEARIFAVVDVWDALSFDRPYRRAWPEKQVLRHIRSLAGSHFDSQVVEVFLAVIAKPRESKAS